MNEHIRMTPTWRRYGYYLIVDFRWSDPVWVPPVALWFWGA